MHQSIFYCVFSQQPTAIGRIIVRWTDNNQTAGVGGA